MHRSRNWALRRMASVQVCPIWWNLSWAKAPLPSAFKVSRAYRADHPCLQQSRTRSISGGIVPLPTTSRYGDHAAAIIESVSKNKLREPQDAQPGRRQKETSMNRKAVEMVFAVGVTVAALTGTAN